jgi:hypothetical protein
MDLAHQHAADVVVLEVEGETVDVVRQLEMRAIPSPTEITVPTSDMSMLVSNPSI